MKTYYFYDGIRQLAEKLKGDESICLAMRPYGFHVGNQIPFIVYPQLLCAEMIKRKKTPRFKFFVVFNDWEQIKLQGPDMKKYPFNVEPADTTLQYTSDPEKVFPSIVDRWSPIVTSSVKRGLHHFPHLKVIPVRYSSFKKDPRLIDVLSKTLKHPEVLVDILKKYTNKDVLDSHNQYVIAVCPKCQKTRGYSKVCISKGKEYVYHKCEFCKTEVAEDYEHFDYWFYHTPLALPRYQILNIDVCITGADKIDESDYIIRKKLAEAYNINLKMPDVLYSPLVTDQNGVKMGKSKGNAIYVDPDLIKEVIMTRKNDRLLKF